MVQLNTESLAEQIQNVLRDRIVSGLAPPGSRISLEELASEFGTSISPIRDAIRMLEHDGLVLIRPRRGVYVASGDMKTFRDVFDVRIALECLAVETAVHRIPPAELEKLSAIYAEAALALARNEDEELVLEPSDNRIHELIVEYSDNGTVRELMQSLRDRITWVQRISSRRGHQLRLSFAEHQLVLESLHSRDAGEVGARLREHLMHARDHTLAILSETKERAEKAAHRQDPVSYVTATNANQS